MTNLDNISNQKINNAGAKALAKGDEMTVDRKALKAEIARVQELWQENKELRNKLASRDALIERLVEAGDGLIGDDVDSTYFREMLREERIENWDEAVAEWKASKDGGAND